MDNGLGGGGRGSGDSACVTGSGNQEGPMEAASFLNKTGSQLRIADASMLVTHITIYTLFRDTKKNIEQNNSAGVALQPIILAKTALISSIISDCNAKPNMADADSIGTSIFFFTNLVICR